MASNVGKVIVSVELDQRSQDGAAALKHAHEIAVRMQNHYDSEQLDMLVEKLETAIDCLIITSTPKS